MNDQATQTTPPGPEAMVSSLIATLQDEYDSLARLLGHFDDHILALRSREKEGIDEATHRTNDEISVLANLKNQRDRKLRLLGRVLHVEGDHTTIEDVSRRLDADEATAEAAETIRRLRRDIWAEAVRTRKRCHDLAFALEYAVHLGRDLLQALQGSPSAGTTKVYTPKGGAIESPGTSSFVNKVG